MVIVIAGWTFDVQEFKGEWSGFAHGHKRMTESVFGDSAEIVLGKLLLLVIS